MPIISWLGSTSSPRRAPKLEDVAMVSASDTRVMPMAATIKGPTSANFVQGSEGLGTPGERAHGRHAVRMQAEDGGDDGGRHDAHEDRRDDLGESGKHQQDGQHAQADQERRPDSTVEPEHERLELGTEALGVRREPEELGQLAHDDDEGEAVHVTDLHLTREQVGDESEPPDPQPDLDEGDDNGQHPGQRDGSVHVAARQQRHEGGEDHG